MTIPPLPHLRPGQPADRPGRADPAQLPDEQLAGWVMSPLSRCSSPTIDPDEKALAAATKAQDTEQVYRRLSHLDTVLDDMSRRAARGRCADLGVDEAAGTGRWCRCRTGRAGAGQPGRSVKAGRSTGDLLC
jgi:hypothetical protein